MSLTAGSRLGPYEIVAPIGSGGMGEVYRARDTKLGREVAIKVLPEALAQDRERLARFEREAQLLASLNHPNIAAIYGLDQSDGGPFLVLELVPGENLKGPVPLDDALNICRQLADALEAAHEKGIVHRDLKPANIKITPEGKVKVLDFGLAKALAGEPADPTSPTSPTLTIAATQTGVLLGTAAYMSPEQARGKSADRRADIWAFGCIFYELLSGCRAFDGDNISDILAAVLKTEPDWTALPDSTPPGVRRLLRRCLEKDPKRRLRDIGDALPELEEAPAQAIARRFPLVWALATAVLAAALLVVALVHLRETMPAAPTTVFQVPPPDKATFVEYPTISPDGRRLAFVATVDNKTLLWVRPLDSIAAQPLTGTEDATYPFWSPDSRFLGFFAERKLKKVDVSGGTPQTLCNVDAEALGGTWNHYGTILFSNLRGPVRRVPDIGGVPVAVTVDPGPGVSHRWPHFLPDGRHFLYFLRPADLNKSVVVVASLDDRPGSKEPKRLLAGSSMAVYSAAHLLFSRDGVLMAQPFDAARLQLHGGPFPVAQQVGRIAGPVGLAAFSASPGGTLAFRTGGEIRTLLVWFDRTGKELGPLGQPQEQAAPRISPDQRRVVVARREVQEQFDIWMLETARDTGTRFTFHAANDWYPVWSPDGGRIVFASDRDGSNNLYQKLSTGTTGEELLLKSPVAAFPTDWSSDGRFILYQAINLSTGFDLWALPLEGDRKPFPVVQTEFQEIHAQLSPDGHWVAYSSNESSSVHVYVQGFPKPGGKFQVSTSGGRQPRWRRDGKELYYLSLDRKMMAVEVKATPTTFEASRPRTLFQTRVIDQSPVFTTYDVTADGQRFLINCALEAEGPPPITVVMNWAPKN